MMGPSQHQVHHEQVPLLLNLVTRACVTGARGLSKRTPHNDALNPLENLGGCMSAKHAKALVCTLFLISFFLATAVAQTAKDPNVAKAGAQPSPSPTPAAANGAKSNATVPTIAPVRKAGGTGEPCLKPADTKARKAGGEGKLLCNGKPAATDARKAGGEAKMLCDETPAATKIRTAGGEARFECCAKPAGAKVRKSGGEAKILDIFDKPADAKAQKAGGEAGVVTPNCSKGASVNKPASTNAPAKIKQSISPAEATKGLHGDGKQADAKASKTTDTKGTPAGGAAKPADVPPTQNPTRDAHD